MAGYTKLFSSIVTSTVWCEDCPTRIVWIAMLAMANAHGLVEGSIPGFAHLSRVTVDEMRRAVEILSSPDKDSRTPDNEGRRISIVPGGWQILNYEAYREKGNPLRASLDMEGYVYYAGEPGGSKVKIGFSKNPWARINDLRVTNPKLEILATERATMNREKERHVQFFGQREDGEWFSISDTLLSLIKALSCRDGRSTTVAVKSTTVAANTEAEAEAEKTNLTPVLSVPVVRLDQNRPDPLPPSVTKGPEPGRPGVGDGGTLFPDQPIQPKPSQAPSKRFEKPVIEQVRQYIQEKGYSVDAEKFWHHYESNGWMVGRNPMKNWKAAVVTWSKGGNYGGQKTGGGGGLGVESPAASERRSELRSLSKPV